MSKLGGQIDHFIVNYIYTIKKKLVRIESVLQIISLHLVLYFLQH